MCLRAVLAPGTEYSISHTRTPTTTPLPPPATGDKPSIAFAFSVPAPGTDNSAACSQVKNEYKGVDACAFLKCTLGKVQFDVGKVSRLSSMLRGGGEGALLGVKCVAAACVHNKHNPRPSLTL